ncbi:uncharacterized protein [Rutidosis leptorrhynchoides]|uniref:uncharacterized protein n=1 Tax=Rutidosis leptorrhynchoides TaxID=125765 RepID=UPI003A99A92E
MYLFSQELYIFFHQTVYLFSRKWINDSIMAIEGIKKSSLRSYQQVEANTMRKRHYDEDFEEHRQLGEIQQTEVQQTEVQLTKVLHEQREEGSRVNAETEPENQPRGPTLMRQIYMQKPHVRLPITVNEHGQPIGANSSQFTHFLGHLSRSYQYCPIYRPWNKVKPEKKDKLLKFLRTKFDFPPTANSWILQSYGRKTKNWRSREMTGRNKDNRARKKLSQMTGKKSFARIREELKVKLGREPTRVDMFKKCYKIGEGEAARVFEKMKDLTDKLGDGATDAPGPDDVFATVMGKAKNGTVKMYGLGVRANHLWGAGPSRLAVSKANAQLMSINVQLEEENARLKAEKNNGPGAQNDGLRVHANGSGDHRLWVDKKVYVKSINFEKVAIGRLRSVDPNTVLNGTELGHGWREVHVQVAIKKDEALFRPYDYLKCIHDVTGTSIAWPAQLIELVRED